MIVGLFPKMFVFVIYTVVNLREVLVWSLSFLNNKTISRKEAALLTVAKKMLTVMPPQSTMCDIHGEEKTTLGLSQGGICVNCLGLGHGSLSSQVHQATSIKIFTPKLAL